MFDKVLNTTCSKITIKTVDACFKLLQKEQKKVTSACIILMAVLVLLSCCWIIYCLLVSSQECTEIAISWKKKEKSGKSRFYHESLFCLIHAIIYKRLPHSCILAWVLNLQKIVVFISKLSYTIPCYPIIIHKLQPFPNTKLHVLISIKVTNQNFKHYCK